MAHTLVGKVVPYNSKVMVGAIYRIPDRVRDKMENFFFVFFVFPCALILSLCLGIPENAGVMYHFRALVDPPEGRG